MKPITFWIQNVAIDQLVEICGAHLEKLRPSERRDLIAYLAVPDEWDWLKDDLTSPLAKIYPLVENLTRHEQDLLIEAIAATLVHHGNPWLETARATVAIAQKEGTSSH